MEELYTVNLLELIKEFQLEVAYYPPDIEVLVSNPDTNRPGLPLTGFFGHFEPTRIQVIGKGEYEYILTLDPDVYAQRLDDLLSRKPPAVIWTSGLIPDDIIIECAKKYEVPVLKSNYLTSELIAMVVASLHVRLAPRITRHGVFVEIYGEGLLVQGESGIGKSETAIELVNRGHRLIADDAVEIKKVSAKTLIGTAPEIIRHYVELRGIGIVDVRRLYGMGAVKETERIDLIINLEPWINGKMYDRLGLDTEYTEIMGIPVPTTVIPVKPGRNLAVVLEIAAMNNRQKKMGYNTAVEFNKKLMGQMEIELGE
ncbi:MAG: HPr(Ser) kinase/phosphatase [Oscillospiraceae bacterium]|nr:HPr(Ser) kinase/phosphatase [Oscillospiraceae bacterium]